jgi:hypothetical protein
LLEDALAIKEGEEPLDEEAKTYLRKKALYKIMTRGLYVTPEDRLKDKHRKEHDAKMAREEADNPTPVV